ncbi:MAG TPA: hypothetical protein VFA38_05910 [Nitrospirales bacterium]|nr:hypothetical protein [Nitrospirales bacterium]
MPMAKALILCSLLILGTSVRAISDTGDLSSVIESFVAKQFPSATTHFWVVNGTQWQSQTEMVVDVNTITKEPAREGPAENRFLLLIVEGRLAAAQNIPLDAQPDCQPEQQA